MSTDLRRRGFIAAAGLAAYAGMVHAAVRSGDAAVTTSDAFDARGDGTTDDTAAIQRALNASRVLVLSAGKTYLIRSVTIPAGRIVLGGGAKLVQATLAAGDGAPMFDVIGSDVELHGITFVGRRREQPRDGYSDSFDGGRGKTGRAYRAAIRMDGGSSQISRISVVDCSFTEIYGACVAARQCDDIAMERCRASDTNFELLMTNCPKPAHGVVFRQNELRNVGTGDPRVNANGVVVSNTSSVVVEGNVFRSIERNALKLEDSSADVVVAHNVLEQNLTDNFAFVQVQSLRGHTARRISIVQNRASNVGAGFAFNTETLSEIVVAGNVIDGTHGTTLGDGLQMANGTMQDVVVSNNRFLSIRRHGLVVGPATPVAPLRRISIVRNEASLDASKDRFGFPLLLTLDGRESPGDVAIVDNRIRGITVHAPREMNQQVVEAVGNTDSDGRAVGPVFSASERPK